MVRQSKLKLFLRKSFYQILIFASFSWQAISIACSIKTHKKYFHLPTFLTVFGIHGAKIKEKKGKKDILFWKFGQRKKIEMAFGKLLALAYAVCQSAGRTECLNWLLSISPICTTTISCYTRVVSIDVFSFLLRYRLET